MPNEQRQAVRALLLTPDHRVLLVRIEEPLTHARFWITPGGGIEEGETEGEALGRELGEEIGLVDPSVGPPIWTRTTTFTWNGKGYRQEETFYLVKTEEFIPNLDGNPEAGERSATLDTRWTTVAEICQLSDTLGPRRLADLLEDLISKGPPSKPIDVSV